MFKPFSSNIKAGTFSFIVFNVYLLCAPEQCQQLLCIELYSLSFHCFRINEMTGLNVQFIKE